MKVRKNRWSSIIIDPYIEVHRTLGLGLLEDIYQDCLALEFSLQKIPFQAVDNLVPVHKAQALAYIKLIG